MTEKNVTEVKYKSYYSFNIKLYELTATAHDGYDVFALVSVRYDSSNRRSPAIIILSAQGIETGDERKEIMIAVHKKYIDDLKIGELRNDEKTN